MKSLMKHAVFLALLVLSITSQAAQNRSSPVGYWLASSPFFNNRPLAIVKTYLVKDKLCGEIIKVIPLNGSMPGARLAKSGPVVLCGFTYSNGSWSNGMIYEQITAKVYPGEIHVTDNGRTLTVRAWNGPFSRSVKWRRTS